VDLVGHFFGNTCSTPGAAASASGGGANFSGSAENIWPKYDCTESGYPPCWARASVVLTGRMKYWGHGGTSFLNISSVSGSAADASNGWDDECHAPAAQSGIKINVGGSQVGGVSAYYLADGSAAVEPATGDHAITIPECCVETDIVVELSCVTGMIDYHWFCVISAPNYSSIFASLHN
jgi:hypothetical protein